MGAGGWAERGIVANLEGVTLGASLDRLEDTFAVVVAAVPFRRVFAAGYASDQPSAPEELVSSCGLGEG